MALMCNPVGATLIESKGESFHKHTHKVVDEYVAASVLSPNSNTVPEDGGAEASWCTKSGVPNNSTTRTENGFLSAVGSLKTWFGVVGSSCGRFSRFVLVRQRLHQLPTRTAAACRRC